MAAKAFARRRQLALHGLLIPTLSMIACSAAAQEIVPEGRSTAPAQANASAPNADIVVTGTRIRGVAPVGSAVLQLDRQDLAKTGQLSTADILNTVPSVLSLGTGNSYSGGSIQGTADLNALAFNKSPNLRGFGPQATLSLVNGHRVPYDGANMNTFDGDNIPTQMLQRVEIVADGTSPIYGADAIAGTVNYVLRAPFTGLETYAQYGGAKGQDTYQLTAVGGYDWGSGGLVVAYQHSYADRLRASSRPSLYNDDFTAYGGPPSGTMANPGNIIVDGVSYAIPGGQDGTDLTLAQIGAAGTANRQNIWTGYDAMPHSKRDQVAVNFTQKVGDWLEIYGDGFYSNRDYDIALFSVAPNNFATITVPNSNYYSPCNGPMAGAAPALVAACETGALTVDYNTVNDIGAGIREGYTRTRSETIGARISLFGDWKANVYATDARHHEKSSNSIYFGNNLATLPALGGTTADTAFNPFCDGRVFDCGNGQFTDAIAGTPFVVENVYKMRDYAVNVDGSLVHLPGGNARVALGAEHYRGTFVNGNSFATTVNKRRINSGFVELYVPIFGADNEQPGLHRLELTVAGRIDDYNDVGQTKNPKVGLNWAPVDGLKFHGSYGTSFRAPGLADNDPNTQAGVFPRLFDGSVISSDLCPSCAGTPGGIAIYQSLGGAARDLKPEKSRSWSLGVDYAPPASGFNASVTYWNVRYTNQVNTPVYNVGAYQSINQQVYNDQIIYNPAYFANLAANNPVAFFGNFPYDQGNANCSAVAGQRVTSQALFNQLVQCINANGTSPVLGAPAPVGNVVAITNGHRLNSGSTQGDGFDISANYTWRDSLGTWRVGALAEYVRRWKVSPIQGAPVVDEVNRFGYPLRFKARLEGGWSGDVGAGTLSGNLFLNYANKYRIDQNLLPTGMSSRYTHIDDYATVDLSLSYAFSDTAGALLRGFSLTVSAQNLFDTLPPLVINTGATASLKFDSSNGSPLGRVVQVQLAKRF